MDSCQDPKRNCQHLIYCFPGKTEHFYWLRTKELCWEASAVSFNFFIVFLSSSSIFLDFSQHLLNFCLDFLSSFKNRAKIQMFLTQNEPDTDHVTRKIGPLYFKKNILQGFSLITVKMRNSPNLWIFQNSSSWKKSTISTKSSNYSNAE